MPTTVLDLATPDGLRSASEAIGQPQSWTEERSRWMREVAKTIRRVRAAGQPERSTKEFQEWLWESNQIAAVGQGNIPVARAFDSPEFRAWFAARSVEPVPAPHDERLRFLTALYKDLRDKLAPFLGKKVPHLKIFRVLAALYPEFMTTVASGWALTQLTRAMGGPSGLDPVECHVWVRDRLDAVVGGPGDEPEALAERMSLAWLLYENFVQTQPPDRSARDKQSDSTPSLVPLPAARRRRGLTAIKGLFQGVLSTLEFVRPGVTREELIDFLRASSPETKVSSLGVAINAFQGELGVIRLVGDRYVLTEQGENALESQDAMYMADWLLTRVLGVDRAVVELRDRGPLPPSELLRAIQSMNPGWTSSFTPQAIVSWLRSMGVIETNAQSKHALTEVGAGWAARVHWAPEPLPKELGAPIPTSRIAAPLRPSVILASLEAITTSVQEAGHFPAEFVARLHIGLWSHAVRHFAILTGLSGAGKTLLARKYGAALVAGNAADQLLTLPVQPGWYDPGALLGYTNPLRGDSYVRTPFLEFLLAANADPEHPYVVVLDEMNLSHPEQYMAPLLSAMETGAPIVFHTEGEFFDGVPSGIPYPSNLVLIGTVNMDETTHGLSDKVLDRAFVLEFWAVDLDLYPRWGVRGIRAETEGRARDLLSALMQALAPARLHFGWRVVDDVLNYLKHAENSGGALSVDAALDGLVHAKILPKLRGEDSPRLRLALTACEQALTKFDLTSSRTKVGELLGDLKTTGSARFWR